MANLVPTYPLEGKGARVVCAPFSAAPWGYRNLEPGEVGSLWRTRGGRPGGPSGSVGRGPRGLWSWQPWLGAGVVPWRRLPLSPGTRKARLCAPFVSRAAGPPWSHGVLEALLRLLAEFVCFSTRTRPAGPTAPARVAPRGSRLVSLPWGGEGTQAESLGAQPWLEVGAGRGGEARDRQPPRFRVSPGGVLYRHPPPLPLPRTVASLCAAGEGTERRKELLFQITK